VRVTIPLKIDPVWPRTFHALAYHPTVTDTLWFTYGTVLLKNTDGGKGQWQDQAPTATDGNNLYTLAFPAPDALFMGGRGVFRVSRDGGETWSGVSDLEAEGIKGLAAVPGSSQSLIALVADQGVLATTDGGATWSTVNDEVDATLFGLWVADRDPMRLVTVRTSDGVLLTSLDRGATWEPLDAAGLVGDLTAMTTDDSGATYASTSEGLFVSTDGGASWSERGDLAGLAAVALSPVIEGQVTVVDGAGRVFQSQDGGNTW
jgi:photosystem II stability/assembly factor-like uncharacterized protein